MVFRTFRRCWWKEELWNGNRERLWKQFFSRDSLFWWVIKTYHSRRKRYRAMLGMDNVAPRVIRFQTREEVNRFLAGTKLHASC